MSGQERRIVILGSASAIGEAAARIWASRGARLVLVGRDQSKLEWIAADLVTRGAAQALPVALDCARADARARLDEMVATLGGLDILLLAYGALGDQKRLESEPNAVADLITTNFTSAVGWCLAAADILERQRNGALIVVGSVAGDRGRRSNYVYGATKGGLARLVEGIAHRLAPHGARAVIVKPGFVDTPMTAHITKKGLLWAKPEQIAQTIVAAGETGGPVVYTPWFWRPIMLIIRHLPTAIFDKLNI